MTDVPQYTWMKLMGMKRRLKTRPKMTAMRPVMHAVIAGARTLYPLSVR